MDPLRSPYPPLEILNPTKAPNHPYFLPGIPLSTISRPRPISDEKTHSDDSTNTDDEVNDEGDSNYTSDDEIQSARSSADLQLATGANLTHSHEKLTDGTHLPSSKSINEANRGGPRPRGRPRGLGRGTESGTRDSRTSRARGSRGRPRGSRGTPRGERKRGGRTGKRGPRAPVEPSDEFKVLQGRANEAWIEGDFDEAANLAMQAIQINPEIFAAHSLLSRAYLAMGKEEESFGVLWSGAHASRDAGVWRELAQRTIQRTDDEESEQHHLLYCYHQILKIDKDDFEARRSRLEVYKARNAYHKGIKECERLLKIRPHNLEVLDQLAALCMKDCQPIRAKEAYQRATSHFMQVQHDEIGGDFDFSDLNIYLDLFAAVHEWSEGILEGKRISRWLLGRREEIYWDEYQTDDREWDLEDDPRRCEVENFHRGAFQNVTYGEGLPMEIRVKFGLFRLQMSPDTPEEAMRHLSFLDPANETGANLNFIYPDLFREIADVLYALGFHADTIQFLQPLQAVSEATDDKFFLMLAKSYHATNSFNEAKECYKAAVDRDGSNIEARIGLAQICEEINESTQALEQVIEIIKLGRLDAVKQARLKFSGLPGFKGSSEERPSGFTQRHAAGKRLLPKLTSSASQSAHLTGIRSQFVSKKRLQRRRFLALANGEVGSWFATSNEEPSVVENIIDLHARLRELDLSVEAGESGSLSDWMLTADKMLKDFICQGVFYPAERYVKFSGYDAESRRKGSRKSLEALGIEAITTKLQASTKSSVHDNNVEEPMSIPDDYKGIEFNEWLNIFCEYALHAASPPQSDPKLSHEILKAASDASVFYHNPTYTLHIQIVAFTCALLLGDEERLCNVARWFMKQYTFASDGFRLFAILNRLHVGAGGQCSWYNSGPNQKFVMRQIKAMDDALTSSQKNLSKPVIALPSSPTSELQDVVIEAQSVATLDPALLVLYGHILATAGSYPHALNYYFRAYAIQQQNPMTLLSIALAYIQYAIKRQAENRHYLIMQGVAFMRKYREVRLLPREGVAVAGWMERMEVEFNEARMWHLLGLVHLAVPAYERCLRLCEEAELERSLSDVGAQANAEGSGLIDFSREAAYALQLILALGGDTKKAREITEKWLVF